MKAFCKKYWLFSIFLLIALIIWVSVIFFGDSSYADENDHIRQIHRFMKGNYHLMSQITTIPGYHLTIAFFAKFFGDLGARQLRLISLFLSLITIPIFYLTARKLNAQNLIIKTLQYVFLPISFFYFPLVYTDIFSLLLVLIAFYLAISKKYSWSAIFLLFSLLVRQNNIVWVAFFWLYTYVQENEFYFSWKKLFGHLCRTRGYIAVTALFLFFAWVNGGIAVGDRERQQVGFYMGNIYFFLAFLGCLFFPIIFVYFKKNNYSSSKNNMLIGAISGVIFASLFVFFPPEVHMYNLKMKFLRNIILSLAYQKYIWVYAGAIFLGCLALALIKLKKSAFVVIPITSLCLIPALLVEQRYFIIPIVLILLLRKEMSVRLEIVLFGYFLLLSVALEYMLLHLEIFF